MSIHRGLPALFDFSGVMRVRDEHDREAEVSHDCDAESEPGMELEEPNPRRYGLAQAIWTLYQAGLVEEPSAR